MSRSATERVASIQSALEVFAVAGDRGATYTTDQAIAIAQVGATLAVAEAIIEQTDESIRRVDR